MIEESKRNLRARKNPKYLNSDEQDPDKVSFAQLKSHHDYASVNYQKTQDAKTLIKLINKINKCYKTYRTQILPLKIEAQRNQNLQRDKKAENQAQSSKKNISTQKETKNQASKQKQKPKPMYNFKSQFPTKDLDSAKNTEAYISKLKQMGSIPSVGGMGKGLYTDQLKKLQSLYPEMKNINYQSLAQNTNPNLFVPTTSTSAQKPKKQAPGPKSIFPQQKLFKRSAYHVAIAYHIYLKKLKEKGGTIGNEIDPTYFAKRLKEGRPIQ